MRQFIHPGEILREEYMAPLGLSSNALALGIGVPANRILDIVRERRSISTDTAIRLARFLRTDVELWTGLQSFYERCKLENENAAEYGRILPYQD